MIRLLRNLDKLCRISRNCIQLKLSLHVVPISWVFQALLKQMKKLGEITLNLPESESLLQEVEDLSQTKVVNYSE